MNSWWKKIQQIPTSFNWIMDSYLPKDNDQRLTHTELQTSRDAGKVLKVAFQKYLHSVPRTTNEFKYIPTSLFTEVKSDLAVT